MKDNDQHLLWEAYLEKAKSAHDESKKDEDSEGKYDDGDGKKEKCDYVPCEEENVQEEEIYGAEGIEGDDEEVVQEESGEVGIEEIDDAIRNLSGSEVDDGDWELAVNQIMNGLAKRIIFHATADSEGGVIGDPDLADRWDFKTAVKDAVEDLLDPATYSDLTSAFKKAFHRAKRDEDEGRFDFSSEKLLKQMKSNQEHDDAPRYHERDREREPGGYLKDLGL